MSENKEFEDSDFDGDDDDDGYNDLIGECAGGVTDVVAKGDFSPEGGDGHGYFRGYASSLFPDAQWTGGGAIHASIARGAVVPIPFEKAQLILKSMMEFGFFQYIQRVMNKNVPGMEWVISPDDFENLLLLDSYRLTNGLPTTETKARLQNPATGNYFHRVTLMEDKNIVGGVRVWVEPYGYDESKTMVGFRYRLERIVPEGMESTEEAAQRIRQRTSQQVLEEASEAMVLKENLKEVEGEPLVIETFIEEKDF